MNQKTCVSCGNHFQGNFCNVCGQKVIPRFTGVYLWERLKEDVVGIENGFFHTFKELWKNPGKMVRSYLQGDTNHYYGPLKYLVSWTALYLLSLPLIGKPDHAPLIWGDSNHVLFSRETIDRFHQGLNWFMQRQSNFYFLGIIPFFSAVAPLFFRKKGFNFTERVIFYTYFCGQVAFCAIVANLFNLLPTSINIDLSLYVLFMLYYYLFFRMQTEFFGESLKVSLVKGMAVSLVGTLSYWTALFLVFVAIELTV